MSDTVSFKVNGYTVTIPKAQMEEDAARGLAALAKGASQTAQAKDSHGTAPTAKGAPNPSTVPVNVFNSGGNVGTQALSIDPADPLDLAVEKPVGERAAATAPAASVAAPVAPPPAQPTTTPSAPPPSVVTKPTTATGAAIGGAAAANGLAFDGSSGPIGAASASPTDPTITVSNNSSTRRYYHIQSNAGADPRNLNNNTFYLDPHQSASINAGVGWSGAITDSGNDASSTGGLRAEFTANSGSTWYDLDDEYNKSSRPVAGTLGPTDPSLADADGRAALVDQSSGSAYQGSGSVAGQATTAQEQADNLKTHFINTAKMSYTSID